MPFYPPFLFPFYNNRYFNHQNNNVSNQKDKLFSSYKTNTGHNFNALNENKKASEDTESSEVLFELFGLRLYFDDILIICILFFLYSERVKDEELFICLLLLLLT